MAVYNNVTVLSDDWYNINTLAGVPVGTAFVIQNISTGVVLLKESATKPTTNDGPVLFDPSYTEMSQATVKLNSLTMWAKATGTHSKAILAIYN